MDIIQTPLFDGIDGEDGLRLLSCINPVINNYSKNALVYSEGDEVTRLGVIVTGSVKVIEENFAGETEITAELDAPGLLGAEFVFEGGVSTVTVRAAEPTEIMFVDSRRLIDTCPNACEHHRRLVGNLLRMLTGRLAEQAKKLSILQKHTTREKLMAYLAYEAKQAGSRQFSIPLNRAQLAEYLCVDRSAMSRELCAMRDMGMLEFFKNAFVLGDTHE